MKRVLVLSLLAVVAVACKKDKKPAETAAEAKPAEAKPAEPTPPTPEPTPPTPAAAGDLSGVAVPNAIFALEGVVSGGQPTDENLQQAKDKGVKTVVNLRAAAEEPEFATEKAKVEELGMKYVHIPIDAKTGDGLNEANARQLATLLQSDKPMLVHCKSGQRVGALLALKAFYADGTPADKALELGQANGLSKPEIVKMVSDITAKPAK